MIAAALHLPRSNRGNVATSKVPVLYKIGSHPLYTHTHLLMPRLKAGTRLEIIYTYIQEPSPGPTPLFGAFVLPVEATCVSFAASSSPCSGNAGSPRLSFQASVFHVRLIPRWAHPVSDLQLPSILWLPNLPFWWGPCPLCCSRHIHTAAYFISLRIPK